MSWSLKDAFDNMVKAQQAEASGEAAKARAEGFKTEKDGWAVSTIKTPDTGKWETALRIPGSRWKVVEDYESRDLAAVGHSTWVGRMEQDTGQFNKLPDIHVG